MYAHFQSVDHFWVFKNINKKLYDKRRDNIAAIAKRWQVSWQASRIKVSRREMSEEQGFMGISRSLPEKLPRRDFYWSPREEYK